jgi:hypothetical protein
MPSEGHRTPAGSELAALAIHVGADQARRDAVRWWPRTSAARDTVRRLARVCRVFDIDAQVILYDEAATTEAFTAALGHASRAITADGVLVLTFSGHTERGDGPFGSARWCLFDAGLELSWIADSLASLPPAVRIVIVCDSCYGAAIARTLTGPQPAVVVASCGDDQTMVSRASSEFVVKMEALVSSSEGDVTLDELSDVIAADTPDCERPRVWISAEARRPLCQEV